MSQGVNVTETEIVFFTEFFEPEIRCVVVHRSAVPLHEQAVIVLPFRAELYTLLVLFRFILTEQVHDALRKFQGTLRLDEFEDKLLKEMKDISSTIKRNEIGQYI